MPTTGAREAELPTSSRAPFAPHSRGGNRYSAQLSYSVQCAQYPRDPDLPLTPCIRALMPGVTPGIRALMPGVNFIDSMVVLTRMVAELSISKSFW